jgi:carboxylate-amine ligase
MLDSIVEFESPRSAAIRDASPADNTLFSRFGVEIEYMVVDRRTLDVRPVVDRLLTSVGGPDGEFCNGAVTWSNELVNHVLELKLTSPADSLTLAARPFQAEVPELNAQLAEHGCILLPTGMHPWMDPAQETRLWPNAGREIYEAYDRIFNCRRHGWANLQSVHLNLPFASDDEFRRLHSAVRLLLPLLPALSASSPFFEGLPSTWLDTRMEVYRTNSILVPAVTGDVVPELITNREDYESQILRPIYDEVRPHDPEGTLADDWMNARGAIARFERGTIEIRVLDTQECPAADLAILQFVVAVLQQLVNGSLSSLIQQEEPQQSVLVATLADVIRSGRAAEVSDRALLRALGLRRARRVTVGRIWSELLGRVAADGAAWVPLIERILSNGCLAERIICATGGQPSRSELQSVYSQLANCLARGEMFFP